MNTDHGYRLIVIQVIYIKNDHDNDGLIVITEIILITVMLTILIVVSIVALIFKKYKK